MHLNLQVHYELYLLSEKNACIFLKPKKHLKVDFLGVLLFFGWAFLAGFLLPTHLDPELFDPDSDPPNLKWTDPDPRVTYFQFNTFYCQVRTCKYRSFI